MRTDTMTALEQSIVDFHRRTLLNINNDIDSDEAREVAVALFRAASMKVGAMMTPRFARWVFGPDGGVR